jgi:hypothetical protein
MAVPGETAVTRPLELTVATVADADDQVTVCPESVFPAESLAVAVSCPVCAVASEAVLGVTVTVATEGVPVGVVVSGELEQAATTASIDRASRRRIETGPEEELSLERRTVENRLTGLVRS